MAHPGVNGGPNGDLYITFRIAPDPVFKRLGNDLIYNAQPGFVYGRAGRGSNGGYAGRKNKTQSKTRNTEWNKIPIERQGLPGL